VTRNPHVFSSILTIAMMFLPILFVFGILLSILINPIVLMYPNDCSIISTISGIAIIITLLVPPPPNKKKRSIFRHAIKSIWKKLVKPKITEDVKFDNHMVHFATIKESTEEAPLDDELIDEDLEVSEVSDIICLNLEEKPKQKSLANICIDTRNHRKIWLLFLRTFISIFNIIRSNFLENSVFSLIFAIFQKKTAFTESVFLDKGFGGNVSEFRNQIQNQLLAQNIKS